jgi:hypothetical protein
MDAILCDWSKYALGFAVPRYAKGVSSVRLCAKPCVLEKPAFAKNSLAVYAFRT